MRCCICDEIIHDPYGFNAQPVADGRCCESCDNGLVIPERFKQLVFRTHADETKRIFAKVTAPVPTTLARSNDNETSHIAARSINAYAEVYGGAEGTFRKRRNDLVTQGFVRDSGRREHGKRHTVWELTYKGELQVTLHKATGVTL